MREIFLMRHGQAEDHSAVGDRGRRLTAEGRAEVERVARAMAKAGVAVDTVWHSPYVRAVETMEIMSAALGAPPRVEDGGLVPHGTPETAVDALVAARGSILVVAHLPLLPSMASVLLNAPLMVNFAPASILRLALLGGGRSILMGFYPADDMARLG